MTNFMTKNEKNIHCFEHFQVVKINTKNRKTLIFTGKALDL